VIILESNELRGSCGKKVLHLQIFIVCYLQFVEGSHLQTTMFLTGYGASTMTRKLNRRLSMSDIATSLKNMSMKTSGSFKGDGTDVWK
jgi:hypothetical protein